MNNDDKLASSMRDFYERLTVHNSALSLRSRNEMALADYEPLAERVKAGDATAFDDFIQKAEVLLDIERQIYGSQVGYFDRQKEVELLTKAAIERQSLPKGRTNSAEWTNSAIIDWWTDKGFTDGKKARTAFMQLSGTRGMTQPFEALWKAQHLNTKRGQRNSYGQIRKS